MANNKEEPSLNSLQETIVKHLLPKKRRFSSRQLVVFLESKGIEVSSSKLASVIQAIFEKYINSPSKEDKLTVDVVNYELVFGFGIKC